MPLYRDGADEIREHLGDVLAVRGEAWSSSKHPRIAHLGEYRRLLYECPEEFRGALGKCIEGLIADETAHIRDEFADIPSSKRMPLDDFGEREKFLRDVGKSGYVRALARCLVPDVEEPRDLRPWEVQFRPPAEMALPVIRHVLQSAEPEFALRLWAIDSVRRYSATPQDASDWLMQMFHTGGELGHLAALKLAEFHPDHRLILPRLVEVLAAWCPRNAAYPTRSGYGDPVVNRAVERILALLPGMELEPATARLLVDQFPRLPISQAYSLWDASGFDWADFPDPLRFEESDALEVFARWIALPSKPRGRSRVMARALRFEPVAAAVATDKFGQWYFETGFALRSDEVPAAEAFAAAANLYAVSWRLRPDEQWFLKCVLDSCRGAVRIQLAILAERGRPRDDGERWFLSLRGKPFDDFRWMVFADWLEEQGHTDRAVWVRANHEAAVSPTDSPTIHPDDPGSDWGAIYSWISQ